MMMQQNSLPHNITNTVEDCVIFLSGEYDIEFANHVSQTYENFYKKHIDVIDQPITKSISRQLMNGMSFTQKQSHIGLRLVKKYAKILDEVGFNATEVLDGKLFKKPFRTIDKTKSVHVDGEMIVCKSPFIADLVNRFKKRKQPTYKRGYYNGQNKEWGFDVNENNIDFLTNAVNGKRFFIDETVTEIKEKIDIIKQKPLQYFPTLTYKEKFVIVNINLPDEYNIALAKITDVREAIMFSKMLGCFVYDDTISNMLGDVHEWYDKILLGDHEKFTVNKRMLPKKELLKFASIGKQTVIMLSSVDNNNINDWLDTINNLGINDQCCFAFRSRNKKDGTIQTVTGKDLNEKIKNYNVNEYSPNKKIIFVSEKIPKTFIKDKIEPNMIIVDLATDPAHYKTQIYLENKPLRVYYKTIGDRRGIVQVGN